MTVQPFGPFTKVLYSIAGIYDMGGQLATLTVMPARSMRYMRRLLPKDQRWRLRP